MLTVTAALLTCAAVAWLALWLVLRVPLVSGSVATALLLAALLSPVVGRLRRIGVPAAGAALLSVFLVLAFLVGAGALAGFRLTSTVQDLSRPLAAGVDRVRNWLTDGPLTLDPQQVSDARDRVVQAIFAATPGPAEGARIVLVALSGLVLVLFLTFFLLKDGRQMWAWLTARVPSAHRARTEAAGGAAWETLVAYTGGVLVVALVDAAGIGLALVVLGVPVWPSLTLLTFIGAFVPILGATASGAVAVLVTLVTNGTTAALVVLAVVLVVQQVEGNVLQPVIMRRAVHLHPVVTLVAVTCGGLVWGVAGALFAVPLLAVAHRVTEQLRVPGDTGDAIDTTDGRLAAGPGRPDGEPRDDGTTPVGRSTRRG